MIVTFYATEDKTNRLVNYTWTKHSEKDNEASDINDDGGQLTLSIRTDSGDVWGPPVYIASLTLDDAREWVKNEFAEHEMDFVEEDVA